MSTKVNGRPAGRKRSPQTAARRSRPAVDPRIRERRVAVARAQGRRRLRWLVAIVALAIVGAAGWLVIHSPLLDVDRVRVSGAQRVAADDVRRASGVRRSDPILFVDLGAVERRVERLPWVTAARVERRLSGDVEIQVTEGTPALWAQRTPDTVALVDGAGHVLADAQDAPAGLPELAGVAEIPAPGHDVVPRAAAALVAELPLDLHGRVARVVIEAGEVTLALRDGPELRLGRPDHVAAKARAAMAVLGTVTGAPPAYVDVRVPSAPVTG